MICFKEWLSATENLFEASQAEVQARSLLSNNENILTQIKNISPEPKYLPILAFLYLNGSRNFDILGKDISDYKKLVDAKKMKMANISKNMILMGNNSYNAIQFLEEIHKQNKIQSLQTQQSQWIQSQKEVTFEGVKPICDKNGIAVYLANSPQACIKHGSGYDFCISQPGNTMWQSYRSSQTSTFYFVFDKNRSSSYAKTGSEKVWQDPLHVVVVDMTKEGPLLTDANNITGNIAEYGENAEDYLEDLYARGVPRNLFKNIQKTPEEQKEEEKLGSRRDSEDDLDWFKELSFDEKSKYIGRGHLLSDSQFDFIWDSKLNILIKQYIDTGLKLTDYQIDKIFTNSNYKATYLRKRLIANEHTENLTKKEFENLTDEQKNSISADTLINLAVKFGDEKLVSIAIERGATNIDDALSWATQTNNVNVIKKIVESGKAIKKNTYSLINAASEGYFDIVKYLAENGAKRFGEALIVASEHGHIDVVKYLLEKLKEELKEEPSEDSSYFRKATFGSMIKYALEKGADNYQAALHAAIQNNRKEILELIIDKVNNFDRALEFACSNGNVDIAKILIEKGAKPTYSTIKYAVRHAKMTEETDILKLIIPLCNLNELEEGFNIAIPNSPYDNQSAILKIIKILIPHIPTKSFREGGSGLIELAIQKAKEFGFKDIVDFLKPYEEQ
jgi:ankyrin repeat protein